jgi:hypothetical protein
MEQLSVFLGQVLALKAMRLQQGNGHREVACAAKFRSQGGVGDKAEEKVHWASLNLCIWHMIFCTCHGG